MIAGQGGISNGERAAHRTRQRRHRFARARTARVGLRPEPIPLSARTPSRPVFALIESFIEQVLLTINSAETLVIVTSDHGHLEQVAYDRGHPKSRVPTWCFAANADALADRMRTPEGIYHVAAPNRNASSGSRGENG
jgi:hypothetical protein